MVCTILLLMSQELSTSLIAIISNLHKVSLKIILIYQLKVNVKNEDEFNKLLLDLVELVNNLII